MRRLLKSLIAHPRSSGSHKAAVFRLLYELPDGKKLAVGQLSFDGSVWKFAYDDEFKRSGLRPIEGIEDLQKVHESQVLFPFFAVRIPDTHRADVRRRLEADHVRDPEPSDLLRIFGRRVVSSPAFELVPAK